MKMVCMLILYIVFNVVLSNVCRPAGNVLPKVYFCNKKLKDDKCGMHEEIKAKQTNVYVRDICGNDEYCDNKGTTSFCSLRLNKIKKYPGEKCVVNQECHSNQCIDGKCKEIADGIDCDESEQCKENSYCAFERKCAPLVASGETCTKDKACPINHVCDALTKGGETKCVKMFSVKKGTYAPRAILCETGFLYDSTSSTYQRLDIDGSITKDTSVCADSTLTTESCVVSTECTYTINASTEETGIKLTGGNLCQCDGKGLQGHCMIGSTDDIFQNYLTLYKDNIEGMKLGDKDNISWLRANEWGVPKLIQAKKEIVFSQVLADIEKCAIRYVTRSNAITLSGLALLIIIALF